MRILCCADCPIGPIGEDMDAFTIVIPALYTVVMLAWIRSVMSEEPSHASLPL
jgi:hypothetical protein